VGILREFIQWLPRYFFPKTCYGCEKEAAYVCEECRKTVDRVSDEPRCPECGKEATFGAVHPKCRRRLGLDGLIGYYKYAGWAKEIVKEAKFGKHHRYAAMKELARELARYLEDGRWKFLNLKPRILDDLIKNSKNQDYQDQEPQEYLSSRNLSDWIIVPVPLHWWREFKRGFNQAELIAGELAEIWGLPIEKLLIRKQYTEPQTLTEKEVKLTRDQEEKLEEKYKSELQRNDARKKLVNKLKAKKRKENIEGAFEINSDFRFPRPRRGEAEGGQISDLRNVILVDDVWTSGATMKECCRILKLAGAKRVWGVTLLMA
jgi:predicted amidophosphoribosyltransferase